VGSALATASFVFPAAVAMLALAYGYTTIAQTSSVVAMRRGVLAVVVALLLLTMSRLGRPTLTTPSTTLIAVAAFVLVAGFQVSAALVVATAGILAVGVTWRERHAAR
jgi:chromate transport protein ChrA